eukprot:gene6888-7104_t
MAPPTVAVLGSGLAGLCAAYELSKALAHLPHAKVVIIEKNSMLGGNSMKASSGINAVNPAAGDTPEIFAADTQQSGGGLSKQDLVAQLVSNSEAGIAFLEGLNLNLSSIVRLGGHSKPRTRSNPSGPNVGFYLVKAVAAAVEAAGNVEVLKNTKVTSIDTDQQGGYVISFTATDSNAANKTDSPTSAAAGGMLHADAVVLATGGFAANRDMLKEYCPSVADLPTTNGPWAAGEGVKLGTALGAALLHMDQVQVHPTGFIDPQDPLAGTKWLAPEKLRGCGAVLLNAEGARFVDELTTRDKATAAIMKQPGKAAWLVLGADGAEAFGEGTLGFYGSKKLLHKFDSWDAAAKHINISAHVLTQQLEQYNAAAASEGLDSFGKQYFPSTFDSARHLWVGQITPVVHYCMGGVAINDQAQALSGSGTPIAGLYAAGEVSGGLHGANRLGGNSLAECVVFGRIAGQQAAEYVLPRVIVLETAALQAKAAVTST